MARSAGNESFWLRVFYNSRVNGAPYEGESLPVQRWTWPTGTYMQRRLREVRHDAGADLTAARDQKVSQGGHLLH